MPAGPVGQSGLQMSRIFPNTGTLQNRVLRSFTRLHLMIWCFHTVRLLLLKLSKTNFQPNLNQLPTPQHLYIIYIYIYIYIRKSIYINSNHPRSSSSHGNPIHESQMPKLVNWDGLTMHEPITSFPRQKIGEGNPPRVRGLLVWSWQGSLKEITLAGVHIWKRSYETCHDHHVGSLIERWTLSLPLSWLGPVAEKIQSYSSGGRWVGFQHLIRQGMRVVIRGNLEFKVGEGSVKCKIIRLQPSWNTWNTLHARRHENWEAGFLDICSRKAEKTFHQFDVCNLSWERPWTIDHDWQALMVYCKCYQPAGKIRTHAEIRIPKSDQMPPPPYFWKQIADT